MAEALYTAIEEEALFLCSLIYRDAVLFYNKKYELVEGLNICFECDRLASITGYSIRTDFKTFKYLKQLLLLSGHPVGQPDYFKADELMEPGKATGPNVNRGTAILYLHFNLLLHDQHAILHAGSPDKHGYEPVLFHIALSRYFGASTKFLLCDTIYCYCSAC